MEENIHRNNTALTRDGGLEMAVVPLVYNICNVTKETGEGDHKDFLDNAQFVTGLILLPLILLVGLIGNTLTLIVLSNKAMVTSCNVFLSALAVADLIKLLNDALYFVLQVLFRSAPVAGNTLVGHMYPVSHYLFNQSVCVASWLTVSVAVERYISVCHPIKAKTMCTVRRARWVSTVVFLSMSLLAVPCALRYQNKIVYNCITQRYMYEIEPTALERTQEMKIYVWFQNLIRVVIPLFVLIILNMLIIHALRKQRVKNKKFNARNRITLMLITDAVMSTVFGYGYWTESNLVRGVREITDLLLSVNSALNFIVYCCFSKIFRSTFLNTFGCAPIVEKTYTDAATQVHPFADNLHPMTDMEGRALLYKSPSASDFDHRNSIPNGK